MQPLQPLGYFSKRILVKEQEHLKLLMDNGFGGVWRQLTAIAKGEPLQDCYISLKSDYQPEDFKGVFGFVRKFLESFKVWRKNITGQLAEIYQQMKLRVSQAAQDAKQQVQTVREQISDVSRPPEASLPAAPPAYPLSGDRIANATIHSDMGKKLLADLNELRKTPASLSFDESVAELAEENDAIAQRYLTLMSYHHTDLSTLSLFTSFYRDLNSGMLMGNPTQLIEKYFGFAMPKHLN